MFENQEKEGENRKKPEKTLKKRGCLLLQFGYKTIILVTKWSKMEQLPT